LEVKEKTLEIGVSFKSIDSLEKKGGRCLISINQIRNFSFVVAFESFFIGIRMTLRCYIDYICVSMLPNL
jgi:hypothetical protein